MPVTNPESNAGDEALEYLPIVGPAIDAIERRYEATSEQNIAASQLREDLVRVPEPLLAEIKLLTDGAPGRSMR